MAGEVDHLVFACPDLDQGRAHVERLLGVPTSDGGRHDGRGTHNALLGLGPGRYLEIVAPDPTQPDPDTPRWFGLDDPSAERLTTWAARATALEGLHARARDVGVDLGAIDTGRRTRPDGVELVWRLTAPGAHRLGGVIPFFIDWGTSPHPSASLSAACRLVGLTLVHPDPAAVERTARALGLPMTRTVEGVERQREPKADTEPGEEALEAGGGHVLVAGTAPGLTARIETPGGVVELR